MHCENQGIDLVFTLFLKLCPRMANDVSVALSSGFLACFLGVSPIWALIPGLGCPSALWSLDSVLILRHDSSHILFIFSRTAFQSEGPRKCSPLWAAGVDMAESPGGGGEEGWRQARLNKRPRGLLNSNITVIIS